MNNNIPTNLYYNYLDSAIALHRVLHMFQLDPIPTDQVEALVHQAILKKLKEKRNNCLHAGLVNLNIKTGESIFDPDTK